jgi:hypothetical protein
MNQFVINLHRMTVVVFFLFLASLLFVVHGLDFYATLCAAVALTCVENGNQAVLAIAAAVVSLGNAARGL